jgi:hypothetical protein
MPRPARLLLIATCAALVAVATGIPTGAAPAAAAECVEVKHTKKVKRKHPKRDRHGRLTRWRKKHWTTCEPVDERAECEQARVQAREDDTPAFNVILSRGCVAPGNRIVEQYNVGEDPHDLVVQKLEDPSQVFGYSTLGPGLAQDRTLPLTKGTWKLYCSITDSSGNHEALGMSAVLQVK